MVGNGGFVTAGEILSLSHSVWDENGARLQEKERELKKEDEKKG